MGSAVIMGTAVTTAVMETAVGESAVAAAACQERLVNSGVPLAARDSRGCASLYCPRNWECLRRAQAQLPPHRCRLRRRARPRAGRGGNGDSADLEEVPPASARSQTPPSRRSRVAAAPASPCSSQSGSTPVEHVQPRLLLVLQRVRAASPATLVESSAACASGWRCSPRLPRQAVLSLALVQRAARSRAGSRARCSRANQPPPASGAYWVSSRAGPPAAPQRPPPRRARCSCP